MEGKQIRGRDVSNNSHEEDGFWHQCWTREGEVCGGGGVAAHQLLTASIFDGLLRGRARGFFESLLVTSFFFLFNNYQSGARGKGKFQGCLAGRYLIRYD